MKTRKLTICGLLALATALLVTATPAQAFHHRCRPGVRWGGYTGFYTGGYYAPSYRPIYSGGYYNSGQYGWGGYAPTYYSGGYSPVYYGGYYGAGFYSRPGFSVGVGIYGW